MSVVGSTIFGVYLLCLIVVGAMWNGIYGMAIALFVGILAPTIIVGLYSGDECMRELKLQEDTRIINQRMEEWRSHEEQ